MEKKQRSPFFYVGDKYKLMPQIKSYFPLRIERYFEPFVGGGSSFLTVVAEEYYLNDIDEYIIKLHKFIGKYSKKPVKLFDELFSVIEQYGLTISLLKKTVPKEYKQKYVKTYYAKYNKEAYLKIRQDFNENKDNMHLLYLLLIYGFNHFLRFNKNGGFNLPVGNVDFNRNVKNSLEEYLAFVRVNKLTFSARNYKEFLKSFNFKPNDFIYLDPPYLISSSEYNKMWSETDERELLETLDMLNEKGVLFAISNLLVHKGKINHIFNDWSSKYIVKEIESNYISYHDNSVKINSKEVLVINYER